MSYENRKQDPLDVQENKLIFLSGLLDKFVAEKLPTVPLTTRFLKDHRLIIFSYAESLFEFIKQKLIIFVGKANLDRDHFCVYQNMLLHGVPKIDQSYCQVDTPQYSPREITAALLSFLKKDGYNEFFLFNSAGGSLVTIT